MVGLYCHTICLDTYCIDTSQLSPGEGVRKLKNRKGVIGMNDEEESNNIEPEDDDKSGPTVLFEESDSVPAFLQGIATHAVVSGSATGTSQPLEMHFDDTGINIRYNEYPYLPPVQYKPTFIIAEQKEIPTEPMPKESVISYDIAYERTIGSIDATISSLERMIEQANKDSDYWNKLSKIAGGIGFVVIIIGIGLFLFSLIALGGISSISGVISGAVAALFYKQYRDAQIRVDNYQNQLVSVEKSEIAFHVINSITDEAERNQQKQRFVSSILSG